MEDMQTLKVLNCYFGSVFTKENTTNILSSLNYSTERRIKHYQLSNKECVLEILSQIKTNKSSRIDNIYIQNSCMS